MASSEVKAVIFDIDGTAIPNQRHSSPSEKVIDAVKRTQVEGICVSCATGRNFAIARRIMDSLGLTDPCILSGGTQIINPRDGEEMWSIPLTQESCAFALSVLAPHKFKIILDGETYETALTADMIEPKPHRLLDVQYVPKEDLPKILDTLSTDSSIASIPVHSSDPEFYYLHITNRQATKEHAVEKLINILGLEKEEVAGVGDGLNDIELFKSVGVKIAMGNAVKELKEAADVVVGTVEQDGLAEYLEGLNR